MEDAWAPIGKLTDFPDGKSVKASLDDETDLLVLRRGEDVLVVSNRCTHQGTPLHRRVLRGPATAGCLVRGRVTGRSSRSNSVMNMIPAGYSRGTVAIMTRP